jgi:hypothetical protein
MIVHNVGIPLLAARLGQAGNVVTAIHDRMPLVLQTSGLAALARRHTGRPRKPDASAFRGYSYGKADADGKTSSLLTLTMQRP